MYLSYLLRRKGSPLVRDSRGCPVPGGRLTAGLLACVALLALGLARASIAAADDGPQSVTFNCQEVPQEFNVPPGVTQIDVTAQGAAGGGDNGGLGGLTTGVLNVTPRTTLTVIVGCRDGYGLASGGGGGAGDHQGQSGENGGGSTGITDDVAGSPRLVAGGGGGESGAGIFGSSSSDGGAAPSSDGGPGRGANGGRAGVGGGASGPAGGAGGNACCATSGGGGGGGGGGYPKGGTGGGAGGTGGYSGGGGGGGASFTDSSVDFQSLSAATTRGDGTLTLSYTGPAGAPQIFRCTGSAVHYTVPAGVSSLSVVAASAAGGRAPGPFNAMPGARGGLGTVRTVTLDATPSVTYSVAVGCHGGDGKQASNSVTNTAGGGGGFGLISGGDGGSALGDPFLEPGASGGGGGGASGIATQYPLTQGSVLLAVAGGGGGGGSSECCDGGRAGDADSVGDPGSAFGENNPGGHAGVLGAVGGPNLGNGGDGGGGQFTAGGGGGGGGGLESGGGGGGGLYVFAVGGGGGGGGAGGRTYLSPSATFVTGLPPSAGLGSGDGLVLITPLWAKTSTTTTVTVPTSPVYDGTAKTASATTVDPAGTVIANPAVTYEPGPAAPVNAGSYTASASYPGDDTHETSSDTKTFTIAQAASQTKVGVADATYDGNPHGATATVTGAGGLSQTLTVTYTGRAGTSYGPSTTAPSAAGAYTASASYAGDANHTASQDSQDYTIEQAASQTKVSVADATYDGNPHGATATVTGAGGLSQTLTVTYTGRAGTSYGPSTTAPSAAGAYTASASYAGDANHTASQDSQNYTIARAPLTITADDKSQQYSDPLPDLTWKYGGFVNSEGPSVLTGTTTCTTTATANTAGNITTAAGDYPITCSGQAGANYDVKYVEGTLKVTREDATIQYTGDTLVTVGNTAGTTSVKLAGAIREAADGTLGDKLSATSLAFTIYRSSDATLSSPVATCTATVAATASGAGAGTCTVSLGEDNYIVEIQLLTNGYYAAPVEDAATTVVTPGTGRTTGGGWLTDPTLKTRSNFGFTVKYLKNGKIQGNSLYIYRQTVAPNSVANPNGGYLPVGDYSWIIKSNAMSALTQTCSTATPKVCTATFTGKANITAVKRDSGAAFSLGGNYQFQVDVTDNGEPGSSNTPSPDTYAIRLWNATGTYYQLGAPKTQLNIDGGNIQVRP